VSYFLSVEAEQELAEALAFYSERASASVARAFLAEFTRAAQVIDSNPNLGTLTARGRRMFPLHRFPYSLIYRVEDAGIRISVVAHQRRRPGYWRHRE
jgi:plasmid stabilization system protein ParE